ncbi:hypothetical protein LCGC14_0228240 [marine sediment metagenome]|jgi:hypothetical protein|uniref:DUF11 domain-containing protein n=1 Tax=marine sediment metagenome TaxID=412755 RepID=A0A0F9UBA0_9ZZZZ
MKTYLSGAAMLLALALPLAAQDAEKAPALAVGIDVYEVITLIDEEGNETKERTAPNNLVPQDTVIISATLKNTTEEQLDDISFKLDVDPSLSLVAESLPDHEEIDFSFATRQKPAVFAQLEALTVTETDGVERAATADDIGAIQVNLAEIDAAKIAVFEYSATIR